MTVYGLKFYNLPHTHPPTRPWYLLTPATGIHPPPFAPYICKQQQRGETHKYMERHITEIMIQAGTDPTRQPGNQVWILLTLKGLGSWFRSLGAFYPEQSIDI